MLYAEARRRRLIFWGCPVTEFIPRPYQQIIISHILEHPRCAVYAGMGMGKTSATLAALSFLSNLEPVRALVLAPLRVASVTWPDEIAKWGFPLSVAVCCGTPAERRAALACRAAVTCINYDNIPWLLDELAGECPFTLIVADESTRLKSFKLKGGSKRARALGRLAFRPEIRRFIELTGTPAPNGMADVWGQFYFLDQGARLGRTHTAFMSQYFRQIDCRTFTKYEICSWAPAAINRKISDLACSLRPEEWFSLDAPVEVPVTVKMPAKAAALYKELCADMRVRLDEMGADDTVTALNAAALSVKCLQLASGAIYVDEKVGTWAEVHDAKIEALKSIISEAAGESVLVVYHFKSDAARILKAIPGARMLDRKPETIREWNRGRIPVLLVHPASAGHGLNLQDGGRILAVFSHWWDLEQYQQVIERIGPTRQAQAGHPRTVYIYQIMTEGTLDAAVVARRKSKKSVQDCLLDACRVVFTEKKGV